jgi:hypothetical protein
VFDHAYLLEEDKKPCSEERTFAHAKHPEMTEGIMSVALM